MITKSHAHHRLYTSYNVILCCRVVPFTLLLGLISPHARLRPLTALPPRGDEGRGGGRWFIILLNTHRGVVGGAAGRHRSSSLYHRCCALVADVSINKQNDAGGGGAECLVDETLAGVRTRGGQPRVYASVLHVREVYAREAAEHESSSSARDVNDFIAVVFINTILRARVATIHMPTILSSLFIITFIINHNYYCWGTFAVTRLSYFFFFCSDTTKVYLRIDSFDLIITRH